MKMLALDLDCSAAELTLKEEKLLQGSVFLMLTAPDFLPRTGA